MASLEEITARLRQAVAQQSVAGKTVTIDLKGEGYLHIDGASVTNENTPADCTIIVSMADFLAMAQGELDPTTAFMTGKLKINGDMAVAMALQPILARAKG